MKTKIIALYIFYYMCMNLYAQDTLILQYPKTNGFLIYDLKTISYDSVIAVSREGLFVKTTNGGLDWIKTSVGSKPLNRLSYVNNRHIYALSIKDSILWIYQSTDFGDKWQLHSKVKSVRGSLYPRSFEFTEKSFGYFASTPHVGFWSEVMNLWRTMTLGYIKGLQFDSGGNGWMAIDNAGLYKSTDYGFSWKSIYKPKPNMFVNISFIDSVSGYIHLGTRIERTMDGGKSWVVIATPDYGAIKFFTINKGIFYAQKKVYLTDNKGKTWREVGTMPLRFDFLNDNLGYKWNPSTYLLSRTSDGGASWDTIFEEPEIRLHCGNIHISRNGVGVAVKGSLNIDNNQQKQLKTFLATKNFGEKWFPVTRNESGVPFIIDFYDDLRGYGVGYDSSRMTWVLMRTENGGVHWKYDSELYNLDKRPYPGNPLFIQALSENVLIIGMDSLVVSASVNGGNTWNYFSLESRKRYSKTLYTAFFVDRNTGWASTSSNLYRTTDAGITWTAIPYPESPHHTRRVLGFDDIYFIDHKNGFALSSYVGALYKTTNEGNTWKPIITEPPFRGRLVFRKKNLGLLIGSNTDMNTFAYITADGGATWEKHVFSSKEIIKGVALLNDTTFWIGGDAKRESEPGYIKRGIIKRLQTYVRYNDESLSLQVLPLYPNPLLMSVYAYIDIKGNLNINRASISLRIYNLLGRELPIGFSVKRGDGYARIIINSNEFDKGLYFYRLTINMEKRKVNSNGKILVIN